MEFKHTSVLLNETVEMLVNDTAGVYVDCTLGGAGHTMNIASKLDSNAVLIGIDQDKAAIINAENRLKDAACKVHIVHANFSQLANILDDLGINKVNGILFDLGVSSYQLDTPERGFSYMHNGPLDMRMNDEMGVSAYDVVNTYEESQLARLIFEYGEEKWARRIASFIVEARNTKPIKTTYELVDIIKKAVPAAARRSGPHPAKRTFQAIRIEVNNELNILQEVFSIAIERLKADGRICIITFHSLEDRIAKKTLQKFAKGCICPSSSPICVCNNKPKVKMFKPISPSSKEIDQNPRARSAKLRVAQKLF